ncbi:acyltransferase family protein [Pseudomonas koreensis]|uniref:acyltransferase family protein n=1 Tax=Pseudomonas koreensis TaxID=198620 RepID=UPI003F835157
MRNNTLDVAKGIGIWLVLIGHAEAWDPVGLGRYIYSFHMPLFFLLAGFFFKDTSLKSTTVTGLQRLIAPYFFIGLTCAIPSLIFSNTTTAVQFAQQLGGTIYSIPRSDWTFYCTPIWFLTCLFCTQTIYSITSKLNTIKKSIFSIVCFALALFIFSLGTIYTPWNVLNALLAIIFYHIGYLLKHYNFFAPASNRRKHAILAIPTALIFIVCAPLNEPIINLSAGITGNTFYFLLASLSGSFLVLQLSSVLRNVELLRWFGRNTIILFGYNYWIMKLGNYIALDHYGWLGSLAIQAPIYFCLAWLSENNKWVSRLMKNPFPAKTTNTSGRLKTQ